MTDDIGLPPLPGGNVAHIIAAQQPTEGEEIMVNTPHGVFTLPLHPSGLSSGPRFVVHVPELQREGVTVRYDLSPAQTESAIRDALIRMGWTPPEGETAATVRAERDAMLAAREQVESEALQESLAALKAENEMLREALKGMEKWASSIYDGYPPSTASIAAAPYREAARAAIAKATGEVK